MKQGRLFLKHLLITLICVVSAVILDMVFWMEWPGGIDSFFMLLGLYLVFYSIPIFILSLLLEIFVIRISHSWLVRYFFGLLFGGVLIGYHLLVILHGKVFLAKHLFIIFQNISIGLLTVFLIEKLFKGQDTRQESV